MKRVLLCLCLSAAVLFPASASAATTIQPGDFVRTSLGGCTLGFVANGRGATYFMTAAHCVEKVRDDVELSDGTVFGDVAVEGSSEDVPDTEDDWALIKVRRTFVKQVRAEVRGIDGAPTGTATSTETALLDTLRFSGHGIPWFVAATTRENRYGVLNYHDEETYDAVGMDTNGDSGGPIVHEESGQALGLVSRLCIGVCTSEGPTVEGIVAKAAANGFAISLRKA